MLPHEPIPDNYEELKDFGDWGMDYAIVRIILMIRKNSFKKKILIIFFRE